MNILIRTETKSDYRQVDYVVSEAFNHSPYGSGTEADVVDSLRYNPDFIPELSLVAETEGKVVGHIIFYPLCIWNPEHVPVLGLGPLAVLPEYQGRGIGSALVKAGLSAARKAGADSVIVLGDPDFFYRFGFKPASCWNITPPHGIPHVCFLAIELTEGSLKQVSGVAELPAEIALA